MIVDLSNPSAPVKVASYDAPGNADGLSVAVVGTTAYLGTANNGAPGGYEFYALNVTTPTAVTRRGAYKARTDVNDIAVNGTDAYLATSRDSDELDVLNIANPAAIAVRMTYNASGTADATGIEYASGKLYLVTRHLSGIQRPDFFILSAASASLLWHAFVNTPQSYNSKLVENGTIVSYGASAADYATDVLTTKAIQFIQGANGVLEIHRAPER